MAKCHVIEGAAHDTLLDCPIRRLLNKSVVHTCAKIN